jgi:histidinol-phosphate/aromatic aminotransferase/cobyric acid decarboxylase-like protein
MAGDVHLPSRAAALNDPGVAAVPDGAGGFPPHWLRRSVTDVRIAPPLRPCSPGPCTRPENTRHTGLLISAEASARLDFCIPCNPYFPTPEMVSRMRESLETTLKHYPSDAETITAELCHVLGLTPRIVAMGNGPTELITWIDRLLVEESLAVPIPTFGYLVANAAPVATIREALPKWNLNSVAEAWPSC